jgi:hypothetical protein
MWGSGGARAFEWKDSNSKSVFNYSRVAADWCLGGNSAYFGDSHPLSFSFHVQCVMYSPRPRDGPVSPEADSGAESVGRDHSTTGTGFIAVITYAHPY